MATSGRGGKPAASGGAVAPKRVLEMMKEATGASDEDICTMLQLCGGDANEAVAKLLESEPGAHSDGGGRWGPAARPQRAITPPGAARRAPPPGARRTRTAPGQQAPLGRGRGP